MQFGHNPGGKAVTLSTLIVLPLVAAYLIAFEVSRESVDIVVQDKNMVFEQTDDQSTSQRWLVYTQNEVFSVAGDWTRGELYAGKRYRELEVGRAYRVRVGGWRVPMLNWYRKILEIEAPAAS